MQSVHKMVMSLLNLLSKRGTAARIAEQMGVAHSTVIRWAERRVPASRLAELSRVTGIPANKLRPDLARAFRKGRAP